MRAKIKPTEAQSTPGHPRRPFRSPAHAPPSGGRGRARDPVGGLRGMGCRARSALAHKRSGIVAILAKAQSS